jgi:hypothetical protein
MIDPKPIDQFDALAGARDDLTPWNCARAAALANLLVATMVFAEFSVMSLVEHDPKAFRMALWLVPFVTVVIWASTAVIYLLALASRALRPLGRRLVGRYRSFPSARSGVWDDWLDRPDPHDL